MLFFVYIQHVNLSELEEYCVNELNGMSKARILSKLNGKPMLESSDTSESDDSGMCILNIVYIEGIKL